LVDRKEIEKVFGELLIEDFAAVEGFEELGDFVWGGDVFTAFGGGFDVHHFTAEMGMGESEGVEEGSDVVHGDAVDDDVGHGVVGDGDHEDGDVAESEFCRAGSEGGGDTAAADQIGFLEGIGFVEVEFAYLRLVEKFGKDGDLDGTGGGEGFVSVRCDGVAGGEIEDVDTEDAVERLVGFMDGGVEFLEEDTLFRRKLLGGRLTSKKRESK